MVDQFDRSHPNDDRMFDMISFFMIQIWSRDGYWEDDEQFSTYDQALEYCETDKFKEVRHRIVEI